MRRGGEGGWVGGGCDIWSGVSGACLTRSCARHTSRVSVLSSRRSCVRDVSGSSPAILPIPGSRTGHTYVSARTAQSAARDVPQRGRCVCVCVSGAERGGRGSCRSHVMLTEPWGGSFEDSSWRNRSFRFILYRTLFVVRFHTLFPVRNSELAHC